MGLNRTHNISGKSQSKTWIKGRKLVKTHSTDRPVWEGVHKIYGVSFLIFRQHSLYVVVNKTYKQGVKGIKLGHIDKTNTQKTEDRYSKRNSLTGTQNTHIVLTEFINIAFRFCFNYRVKKQTSFVVWIM